MWVKYELAIHPLSDWQLLQINILQNRKSTKLHFTATNKLRCSLNILPNQFKTITNRIDTYWLSLMKETYKQKCKKSLFHHLYYLINQYPLIENLLLTSGCFINLYISFCCDHLICPAF
jgi:hypothetical protein